LLDLTPYPLQGESFRVKARVLLFEYKSCRQDALAKATMTICKLIIQKGIPATRIRGGFGFKKNVMNKWLEKKMSTHSYEKTGKYQVPI